MPTSYPRRGEGLDRRLPLLPPRPEAGAGRVRHLCADRPRRRRHRPPRDPVPDPGEPLCRRPRHSTAPRPGPGWTCFGGPGVGGGTSGSPRGILDNAGWIAAWAPGFGAGRLRAGTGIELPAGSRIVMQVHYNLLNGSSPDRSRAVLTTVPAATGPPRCRRCSSPLRSSCLPERRGRPALRPHRGHLRPGRPVRRRRRAHPDGPPAALRQGRRPSGREPRQHLWPQLQRPRHDPGGRRPHAPARTLDPRRPEPRDAAGAAPARDPELELPLAGRLSARPARRGRPGRRRPRHVPVRHEPAGGAECRGTCSGERGRPTRCASASSRSPRDRRAACASSSSRRCIRAPRRPTWARSSRISRRGSPTRGHELARAVVDRRGGGVRHVALARDVVATARRFRPDVVYAHFLVPAGLLAVVAGGAPAVVTAHGQDVENAVRSALVRHATRITVRRAAGIVAVSGGFARDSSPSCPRPAAVSR